MNKQWQVEGTSFNKLKGKRNVYTVTLYEVSERWACSCPAHKYQSEPREDCQHILKTKLSERITTVAARAVSAAIQQDMGISSGERVFKDI